MTELPSWELMSHDLGSPITSKFAVVLEPLIAAEANMLGSAFATIDPWAVYNYPEGSLIAFLAAREAGAPRFGIRCDGVLAGAIGLRMAWLKGPYIQFLGLLPEFHSRGLGAHVLDWLTKEAERGLGGNIWVCASSFNARALAFYQREGFVEVVALPGLVREDFDEILLRKRLR